MAESGAEAAHATGRPPLDPPPPPSRPDRTTACLIAIGIATLSAASLGVDGGVVTIFVGIPALIGLTSASFAPSTTGFWRGCLALLGAWATLLTTIWLTEVHIGTLRRFIGQTLFGLLLLSILTIASTPGFLIGFLFGRLTWREEHPRRRSTRLPPPESIDCTPSPRSSGHDV